MNGSMNDILNRLDQSSKGSVQLIDRLWRIEIKTQ